MHWTGKVESIAFTVFGKSVAWYGIIITCAMLLGLFLAIILSKRLKLKSDDLLEMFLICIPIAVLGARLGYVFVRYDTYLAVQNFGWSDFVEIFAVWDGGLTIMTGAPCGVLGALIWCKWRKVDFLNLVDTIICVVLLSQALGRWGNFFNQEIYGQAVTNPSLQWFPYAVYVAKMGGFYQATFFYESVADALGFLCMLYLSRHLKLKGSGLLLYGAFYGTIRFILEFFREFDPVYSVINFNQIICITISLCCVAGLIIYAIIAKKKGKIVWYPHGIPDDLYKNTKRETENA